METWHGKPPFLLSQTRGGWRNEKWKYIAEREKIGNKRDRINIQYDKQITEPIRRKINLKMIIMSRKSLNKE